MGFSAPNGKHHVFLQIICLSEDHHPGGRLKAICRIGAPQNCPCAQLLLWLHHTDHGSHFLGIHGSCRKSRLLVLYCTGKKVRTPEHVNDLETLQNICFRHNCSHFSSSTRKCVLQILRSAGPSLPKKEFAKLTPKQVQTM